MTDGLNPHAIIIDELHAHDAHVHEGQECPQCGRRVPFARKPSTPKTKVMSTRVPVDDSESFEELLVDLAKHLGIYEKPHWRFWAINYAAAAALQDASLRDALA